MSKKNFVVNKPQPEGYSMQKSISRIRRDHKKSGRRTLKKHYALLLLITLIMILFGTEIASKGNGLSMKAVETDPVSSVSAGYMLDEMTTSGSSKPLEVIESWILDTGEEEEANWDSYNNEKKHTVLGIPYSRGTLSYLVNGISSGKPNMMIIKAIDSATHSEHAGLVIMIIVAAIFRLLVWAAVFLIIGPSARRIFLEARLYDKVQMRDFTHILSVKKWRPATLTILLKEIYLTLWFCTIIGGIIKYYSYMMVPYIVAENPGIKARDAITLSRRMMYGHKWEMFLLELTYFGWAILGIFTLGLTDMFYASQYKIATISEYYVSFRAMAKENNIEGVENLDDDALFEKVPESELLAAYSDISEQKEYIAEHEEKRTGIAGFLLGTFGIWIGSRAKKKEYNEIEVRKFRISSELLVVEGAAYPLRLNPRYNKIINKERYASGANYLKAYSIGSLIIMFFVFCFIGWAWEVSLHLIKDGVFVNRGAMHGPWLPIYGCGGVFMLLILNKFRKKPGLEILLMVVLSGFLEYFTSWYLEMSKGMKYWDYSGYFLNLNGRICAEGLIVFAIAGAVGVYFAAPGLDELISRIPRRTLFAICLILLVAFGIDSVYSHFRPNEGKGITDYSRNTLPGVTLAEYDSDPGVAPLYPDAQGKNISFGVTRQNIS